MLEQTAQTKPQCLKSLYWEPEQNICVELYGFNILHMYARFVLYGLIARIIYIQQ
jgi:hypothetical protein